MGSALDTSIGIVAYLALFAGFGIVFLFVNLLVGKFVRADNPSPEKGEIYECGEPTIGSSFVQFDLRFYVVALLFIIFDVEVAFFFPWAVVFGKATHLTDSRLPNLVASADEPSRAVSGRRRAAVPLQHVRHPCRAPQCHRLDLEGEWAAGSVDQQILIARDPDGNARLMKRVDVLAERHRVGHRKAVRQCASRGRGEGVTRTVVMASLAVLGLDFVLTAMMFSI